MHLKTGVIAMIVAAAGGAAAGRATSPRFGNGVAPGVPAVASLRPALDTSIVTAQTMAGTADRFAFDARSTRAGRSDGGRGSGVEPAARAVVYVAGAVAKPGVYTLGASARADDAVRAAGGATAQADLVAIDLAARVEDGQEIAVPQRGSGGSLGADVATAPVPHARRRSAKRGHRKPHRQSAETADTADVPTETVNVNAADEATLETLPGIGPSLAERIVAFRDLNGPFASNDELLDVGGMTAGKVDAISPYVTFR